jgi:hypothetical protein
MQHLGDEVRTACKLFEVGTMDGVEEAIQVQCGQQVTEEVNKC